MTHIARWGAVLAVAALAATPATAQTLRWTSQGDALTMDPHSANEGPTISMLAQIYDALVTRDYTMALQPSLAESWTAAPDGWTFKLRQGVKFHDGADFTAEDVAFSFERAKAETSDYKEQANNVASVEVIDDHTVKLVTNGPNPILPNQLTSIFIMDKGWAEANNVTRPQNYKDKEETYTVRNANGTGQYKLVDRRPDELTVLEAHDGWWGEGMFPGNIQRIEYRPIANAATRVAALLSGEVDFVLDPPLQDLKRIEATDGLKVTSVAQIRSIFFGMDMASPELRSSDVKGKNPFADPRVRLAVNHALDKEAIQRVVMEGLSFPTGMITPPGVLGNTPENDKPYAYDPERAKALLAEAGYPDGFAVQLDCPNDRYNNDEKICQAAVAMLARVGIKVSLDAVSKSIHFPKIQKKETDFYLLGWGVPTLDSHYVFAYLVAGDGSWNATGYSNPRVNEITKLIETETDLEKRAALIEEAWGIVKAEAPYAPIHHQVIAWAMSDKFDIPIGSDDSLRPRFIVAK